MNQGRTIFPFPCVRKRIGVKFLFDFQGEFMTAWGKRIRQRWREPNGYREVLKLALPLILSTGSWSIQQFVDRMFLTWYSPAAIAASLPAGLANWTFVSLFIGTAAYVNTFVAQYFGAKRYYRIGPSVWQGIYLALLTGAIMALVYPFTGHFFSLFQHPPEVAALEVAYFRILLLGAPWVVASSAISGFFTGRGKTMLVMWVNLGITALNILLDYLWIFGKLGFPESGIRGAGWATVTATITAAILFFLLMIRPEHNRKFNTLRGWQFRKTLFSRLLRFGLPQGIQFLLELIAFTIFILIVGKIGMIELAASNIAFNVNTLAFLPMEGMSVAVSVLVGQHLGRNRPGEAEYATLSAFHLAFFYFGVLAIGYFFFPGIFLLPFKLQADPVEFAPIAHLTAILLRFVAVYCLFDALNMIFSGALKGAGDTRFVALVSVGLAWVLLLIPSILTVYVLGGGIYLLWTYVTLYIAALGIVFWRRFARGGWKSLRVIETPPLKNEP